MVDAGARHLPDLPEGYHTAPRAQAWQRIGRWNGRLRPGCRVVGRCQVEEMALRLPRGQGPEYSRSRPLVRRRLALTPGGMKPQLTRDGRVQDDIPEAEVSTFGTKTSPSSGRAQVSRIVGGVSGAIPPTTRATVGAPRGASMATWLGR